MDNKHIVIDYDLKDFVSNKHIKLQCTFVPNYYALQLYKYIIAYGNSTQQLCAAVPVQASAEKICICKFTKRSGLHDVMVIEKNMERRRRADQKSAVVAHRSQKSAMAAQANYRRRRRGAIGAGL